MPEHSEYPSLSVNSNAPFRFYRMECLDFFAPSDWFIIVEAYFQKTIQFLYLNIIFEMINNTICFFTQLLLDFLMLITDVRRSNGSYLSCSYARSSNDIYSFHCSISRKK